MYMCTIHVCQYLVVHVHCISVHNTCWYDTTWYWRQKCIYVSAWNNTVFMCRIRVYHTCIYVTTEIICLHVCIYVYNTSWWGQTYNLCVPYIYVYHTCIYVYQYVYLCDVSLFMCTILAGHARNKCVPACLHLCVQYFSAHYLCYNTWRHKWYVCMSVCVAYYLPYMWRHKWLCLHVCINV